VDSLLNQVAIFGQSADEWIADREVGELKPVVLERTNEKRKNEKLPVKKKAHHLA
jgi:hypothetical protein